MTWHDKFFIALGTAGAALAIYDVVVAYYYHRKNRR